MQYKITTVKIRYIDFTLGYSKEVEGLSLLLKAPSNLEMETSVPRTTTTLIIRTSFPGIRKHHEDFQSREKIAFLSCTISVTSIA